MLYCVYNIAQVFPKCNHFFSNILVDRASKICYNKLRSRWAEFQLSTELSTGKKEVDLLVKRRYTIRTIRDTGQVQTAGNVKQEGQIPEFNTPQVPEGSVYV